MKKTTKKAKQLASNMKVADFVAMELSETEYLEQRVEVLESQVAALGLDMELLVNYLKNVPTSNLPISNDP